MKLIGVELHQALAEADEESATLGTAHVLEQGLLVVLRQERDAAVDRERMIEHGA